MTVDEARRHHATILAALKLERSKRDRFFNEPCRSQAMREMTLAIEALNALAIVLAQAADAGILESGHVQAPLIDVPSKYP